MLDINLIRKHPDEVKEKLARRGMPVDLDAFLKLDENRRNLIAETEQLKAKKNKTSAQIPLLKKDGQDIEPLLAEMKKISTDIREGDQELAKLKSEQEAFLAALPNLPADDVVAGGKENNQVVRTVGSQPEFSFEPRHHVDLVEKLDLVDFERGAKLGGNGYWLYTRDGARLEWALLNFFVQEHLKDQYEMMLPPHILNYQCGYTAGQFPKFEDDVFQIRREEDGFSHFILPTAETALVNLFRDEVLDPGTLPRRYFAYTPCYRKEAGSYRAEERGMIRGHQFNKIELFQYTLPHQSEQALLELVDKAVDLVQQLGLHFRVSKLAAADCSASMQKTYDIEVYMPSMKGYKEVSSVSSAGDYQARRGNIKYRSPETGKLDFVHTLNGSGLATSRIFPAILEQNQQEDGSVLIPEVLRPYMDQRELLEPR